MDKDTVTADAKRKTEVAVSAQSWVNDNNEKVESCGTTAESVNTKLRKKARVLRSLERAAGRKMCVGVFGASQAGKSYLLSSLAMDDKNKVWGKFAGETHDFLADLNPGGGKESTGLVTRFTLTEPENIPSDYPVHVRLLSETELVKIFANSYFCDSENNQEVDKDRIRQALQEVKNKQGSGSSESANLDKMEDLREYVTSHFRGSARGAILEDIYWDEAVRLAPKLGFDDRVKLYSIIWDEIPQFTELFRSLLESLDKLGYAEEAFCGMDALLPREASILDVDSLNKNDFSQYKASNTINMKTRDGRTATIHRKNATAIVAELTLVMSHKPAAYFDHTDLLDFPGYKPRLECSDIRDYLEKKKDDPSSGVEQFFRRGKVAYLFQRYTAERELTSLLLCVADSSNTPSLPGAIEEWIINTHGKNPEDRLKAQTALFYIFTKSDHHFEDKLGAKMDTRWDNTVQGTFTNQFGQPHDQSTKWVESWTPGQPFNNLYLLRNVNVKWGDMMDFDSDNREIGVSKNKTEYKDALRNAFINSPEVKKYFKNPQKAFDEIFALNDGGISYIKNSLEPVCDPNLKISQIALALDKEGKELEDLLTRFYSSGNQEEELEKKDKFVKKMGRNLLKNPKGAERFPELLSHFRHPAAQLVDLKSDADLKYEEYKEQLAESLRQEREALNEIDEEVDEDDPLGLDDDDSEETDEQGVSSAPENMDEHHFYASKIVEAWSSRMRELANNTEFENYYAIPKADFLGMLDEMEQAIERIGVKQQLEKKFREIAEYSGRKDTYKEAHKQAAYANGILSDFASYLGKNPNTTSEKDRQIMYGGKPRPVFNPAPDFQDYPSLPEKAEDFAKKWRQDWLVAFYGMARDNVLASGGKQIDLEQNKRLGDLIKKINKAS